MNLKKSALVGIDVSYKTFNAYFSGTDCLYKNTRIGWQKLLREAPPGSVYAMEATGNYHFRLASYLHGRGMAVIVLNPYYVKHWIISQGGKAKTDRINARDIYFYVLGNGSSVRHWQPLPPLYARARVIVTLLSSLSNLSKSANNINHSISLVVGKTNGMLNPMLNVYSVCREQEKALEMELVEIVKKIFPNQYNLLLTIPGLGSKSASVFLATTRGFSEFASYRQLTSYIGLAPSVEESGTSVRRKSRITKTGNNYLRSLLFMCAMTALSKANPCKELYVRLVKRGKPKKLAIIAVMHRLVKISFGVVQSGEPYRGNNLLLA